ncbi:EamA family transporter RarD [Neisseria iguanae]|uniref:EamA family transporter RarD n=1 Tax=Neisseria iguanae TaxID=90242 RepID=A0A2P7TXJ7_9NEIS|nr:EamA family transporter RarD [Neisseria iguanae]PSJ79457.1 EamA family transporter RarD [Neisseria iguanae]
MSIMTKGVLAAVCSNILFAMLFLYGLWMRPMTGTDVFAWRMVAMLFALFALMNMTRSWPAARSFSLSVGTNWKRCLLVVMPTPILASQLWLFVWAPVNGEGLNVAAGYFLFPLAMMLAGRIWFQERLNRLQHWAVAFACAGVAWSLLHSAAFSWATVWVFATYPVYYLFRRGLGVPSLVGLFIDLMLIAPFMLVYILTQSASLDILAAHPHLWFFVVLLGINSAVAMYLNLQANGQLPVAVFSMLSYLEPILLFVVSVTLLEEPLEAQALVSYGLIWIGLCIMMYNGWRSMTKPQIA